MSPVQTSKPFIPSQKEVNRFALPSPHCSTQTLSRFKTVKAGVAKKVSFCLHLPPTSHLPHPNLSSTFLLPRSCVAPSSTAPLAAISLTPPTCWLPDSTNGQSLCRKNAHRLLLLPSIVNVGNEYDVTQLARGIVSHWLVASML